MARSPLVSRQQMANFELSDFFIVQSCGFEAHLGKVTDEHEEIIAAIRAGDAAAAQTRAMEHINSIALQVVDALGQAESV